MFKEQLVERFQHRSIESASGDDQSLGKLQFLAGVWQNADRFAGRGWNMIALPFSSPALSGSDARDYRVLSNQYNETLILKTADKGVPNRGVIRNFDSNLDQTLIALDYEQTIKQIKAKDDPQSGKARENEKVGIHHEPGLWLHIVNHDEGGIDIARLGTIPHGNSLLAMGRMDEIEPKNVAIQEVNPFPFLTSNGQTPLDDPLERYLAPYAEFVEPNDDFFPADFDLRNLHGLLQAATPTNISRAFKYSVSTEVKTGGIVNTPFIETHADAAQMTATFWVYELDERDHREKPVMVMQYMQIVMLDFFDNFDGTGLIRWPHISLNTMVRVAPDPSHADDMKMKMLSNS